MIGVKSYVAYVDLRVRYFTNKRNFKGKKKGF